MNYVSAQNQLALIDAEVRDMALVLEQLARSMKEHPFDLCLVNIPGEDRDPRFAGCRPVDASTFPTPDRIQKLLERRSVAVERLWAAWHATPGPDRRGMMPPKD